MYNIDGFLFEDEATAELAKKEEENIRYIKDHTALENAEVVLKLYNKLLEQKLFVTPVGIRFLLELQNVLLGYPLIGRNEIPSIPVSEIIVKKEVEEESGVAAKVKEVTKKVDKKVEGNYKKPFIAALFFAIIFAFSVIGMFVVAKISGNNVNIMNYRNEILNEYSTWESQLQEKEAELKIWEKELENRGK